MKGSSREGWAGNWWVRFLRNEPDLPGRRRWYSVLFQGDHVGSVVRWQSGYGVWRLVNPDGTVDLATGPFKSRQAAAEAVMEGWVKRHAPQ